MTDDLTNYTHTLMKGHRQSDRDGLSDRPAPEDVPDFSEERQVFSDAVAAGEWEKAHALIEDLKRKRTIAEGAE